MKPARIRLIDFGGSRTFRSSMQFAESLIEAYQAPFVEAYDHDGLFVPAHPRAEIEYVRVRDWQTVAWALTAPAHVLHLMGHGSNVQDEVGFWSDDGDRHWSLMELAEYCVETGYGIDAHVVLADCCDTGRRRFAKGMRDLLQRDTCYIGTGRQVGWEDGTTYAASFYAAYLRRRGKGLEPVERGLEAAERAGKAFEQISDLTCPYRAERMTPSRSAKRIGADA